MKIKIFIFVLLFFNLTSAIVINEFVSDPQTDWSGDGSVTTADEWIEIFNNEGDVNISNWLIVINDTTPSTEILNGVLKSGEYLTILNPSGTMNLNGEILLYDSEGVLVDKVTYGNFDDGNISDNAPDGNAENMWDECVSRIPNGYDTDVDSEDFKKELCSFGRENGVLPPNQQGLMATIGGRVRFNVTPEWIDFGTLSPGSYNNPALNGPIIFNINGSSTNVHITIENVIGELFRNGLKIDGDLAEGKSWVMDYHQPIKSLNPTLDVPENYESGEEKGIIVYTVSGE